MNGSEQIHAARSSLLSLALESIVPKCLSFRYKIYPILSGTLKVRTVQNEDIFGPILWEKFGPGNNNWTTVDIDLTPFIKGCRIYIEAKRGNIPGIIALDNLSLRDGNCL